MAIVLGQKLQLSYNKNRLDQAAIGGDPNSLSEVVIVVVTMINH